MFYVINAPVSISTHTDAEAPKSNPLDPAKPNLVLLHAGTSSSAAFSLQVSAESGHVVQETEEILTKSSLGCMHGFRWVTPD